MKDQLIEIWNIHNRISLYQLDAIEPDALDSLSASKGRTVAEQFAHIHKVRLMWIEPTMHDLMKELVKIEKERANNKQLLMDSLEKSASAIPKLLEAQLEGGRIKGFKPHPVVFVGYLLSHESHHRGQIMLTLKQAGHPVDKKYNLACGNGAYGNIQKLTPPKKVRIGQNVEE